MKSFSVLVVVFAIIAASSAQSTEKFQKEIRPLAEECQKSVDASDDDVEIFVHLKKDFSPGAKCLGACVMDAIGMMKGGVMASEEEILVPYKAIFKDDPRRLANAEEVIARCRKEAMEKFPKRSCDMAHHTIFCTIVNTVGY